jgi:3-hydroxybutyryl-CoA dehydrogenase
MIDNKKIKIGVLGAGTMGAGIAQVAAQAGNQVVLVDINQNVLDKSKDNLKNNLKKLVENGKLSKTKAEEIIDSIVFSTNINDFFNCNLIIEAIIENISLKHSVFLELESIVSENCILASNTSSISISAIGPVLKKTERIIGIHFFNPAPVMSLVEIIPALQTSNLVLENVKKLIDSWNKITVVCKDTPGFIVNRIARPFYGEALRIYEEGIADFATIDWAMTEIGAFKMGPFTLMDYIGNDVNYTVTETVFKAFYYDPRYKPSLTQKQYFDAGFLGKKTGKGYYDYNDETFNKKPNKNIELGNKIVNRILVMLINEAIDALYLNIASKEDIDLAMTKGVNYPKGLLKWAEEITLHRVLERLQTLYDEYKEDRYRPSPLLKKLVKDNKNIF